jgi:hypothetical protein
MMELKDDTSIVHIGVADAADTREGNKVDNMNSKKGRGRTVGTTFLQHFTDDLQPYKLKSAVCKHCHIRFNHHKKSEQAMKHLKACRAFCRAMNGIKIDARPEWYGSPTSNMNKRAKLLTAKCTGSPTASASSSTKVSSVTRTSSMKDFLLPKMDAATKKSFSMR